MAATSCAATPAPPRLVRGSVRGISRTPWLAASRGVASRVAPWVAMDGGTAPRGGGRLGAWPGGGRRRQAATQETAPPMEDRWAKCRAGSVTLLGCDATSPLSGCFLREPSRPGGAATAPCRRRVADVSPQSLALAETTRASASAEASAEASAGVSPPPNKQRMRSWRDSQQPRHVPPVAASGRQTAGWGDRPSDLSTRHRGAAARLRGCAGRLGSPCQCLPARSALGLRDCKRH